MCEEKIFKLQEEEISELLSEMKSIVEKYKNKKQTNLKNGELFNVFDIIGLKTEEVRLHSAFLAELLNPQGSHGCNDKFLKEFCKLIIFDDFPTKNACVAKEFYIDSISKDYEHGGQIDILIKSSDNKYAIVIENKIYAGDQNKQLKRYRRFCEENLKLKSENYRLLYLTLQGKPPSEDSVELTKGEMPYWEDISYRQLINNWLEKCMHISDEKK